ncbi:MAG TPA: ATP-binding protein [Dissulfurispiraceae bacterium]
MRLSLKAKVTAFITFVVITISLVSTFLFISAHTRSLEREIAARGITMAESIARAVSKGLASENLEFIKEVSSIAHTPDVNLAQVYTPLWLAVDAYPAGELHALPDPAAIGHFGQSETPFYKKSGLFIDFYVPVDYESPSGTVQSKRVLIGYVRLRLSTDQARQAVRDAVAANILASILITIIAVVFLNAFIRKYVLRPVLDLHTSISKHKEGEFPDIVPVHTSDEIGELSSEFNRMSVALREREERLSEERERLAVTLRSIGDAVIVTDIEGIVTLLNTAAEKLTGWTMREAVGKPLTEVFHIINEKTRERCENPVEAVIKTGLVVGLANHTALIGRDGTEMVIEDSAAPIRDRNSATIGVVLVFRDVTEKRKTEEELLKVEKLQSVGLLAGGLAHDFNNLLTSIIGNISMAKIYTDAGGKAHERLEEAEKAARRATDLTYQLLTFSKGGVPIRKAASVVDIIRELASFTLSGTNVAQAFLVPGEIWNVDVDIGQMSQVFNNLIINAVQAMPGGGKISFILGNAVLSDDEIPPLQKGEYVRISVGDTGAGIPEEHLPRIFDPYFTTKEQGSGLGLASAYSIIRRHDGHITVESKVGAGTTFTIYLPASKNKLASEKTEGRGITTGHGRILVLDDEASVRNVAGEMLRTLGYEVEFATNGTEAIETYRKAAEAGNPFDAVILDLTIPGDMGGKEAVLKLREIDPNMKAIVSSGYSVDPVMAEYEVYGFKGVITKPYTIESFSRTLRETLGA